MKYLDKFARYLSESNHISTEDIEEFIIPFQDLGLECVITDFDTISYGEFIGRKCRKIIIDISILEKDIYGSITNQNIWEILDELITLKNRLESEKVFLAIGSSFIIVTFLENDEVDSDIVELSKLYRAILDVSVNSHYKNLFIKSIYPSFSIHDKKIIIRIKASEYTDRRWNSLVKDIDFSKFDIIKSNDFWSEIILTIVPKKKL